MNLSILLALPPAQSTGTVEYTDCISIEGLDPTNECPGYDIKPSDGEASALESSRTWSNPSFPLLPGRLWSGVVVPDRVIFMGEIEQTPCVNKWLMLNCDCYIEILETMKLCEKKGSMVDMP